MPKRLKFTGRYRDLIPRGFRFQKLYASNYRCYHTYNIPGKSTADLSLWVWQKNNSVEIDDWHGLEVPIIEYFKSHPFTPYDKTIGDMTFHKDYVVLLCNRKTLEVKENKGEPLFEHFMRMKDGEITEEEHKKFRKEYHETYREITVNPSKLFDELKKIEGMYEVVEDEDYD